MDFEFSDEQHMLRDTLASFLRDRFPFEERRAATATGSGAAPGLWPAFAAELGILGISVAEEAGGLGGGSIDDMIVMEELGRALSTEPWLSGIVMAGALLKDGGGPARRTLEAIVAGTAVVVPAMDHFPTSFGRDGTPIRRTPTEAGFALSGRVPMVHDAMRATHFIVAASAAGASPELFLIAADAPGVLIEGYALVDGTRAADLKLTDVPVSANDRLAEADDAARRIATAFDAGVAGLCAEALGIQRMLLQATVEYTKQRQQFGRPIAQFQVLQHRMAEMFVKVEEAASMAYLATLRLTAEPAERGRIVSAAKVVSDRSGRFVGQQAVQIHGGMGMSKELPIADSLSRLTAIAQQLGSTDYHLRRYETASFAAVAA